MPYNMSSKRKKHAWTLILRAGELAQHGMNMAYKDQHKIFMCMPSCIKSNMYQISLYENEYV